MCYKVTDHVSKYWEMAGFRTMSLLNVRKNVMKEAESYEKINKNKN